MVDTEESAQRQNVEFVEIARQEVKEEPNWREEFDPASDMVLVLGNFGVSVATLLLQRGITFCSETDFLSRVARVQQPLRCSLPPSCPRISGHPLWRRCHLVFPLIHSSIRSCTQSGRTKSRTEAVSPEAFVENLRLPVNMSHQMTRRSQRHSFRRFGRITSNRSNSSAAQSSAPPQRVAVNGFCSCLPAQQTHSTFDAAVLTTWCVCLSWFRELV